MYIKKSVNNYLDLLSNGTLSVGSGSALSLSGALGASLVLMWCKKILTSEAEDSHLELEFLEDKVKHIKQDFIDLIDADVEITEKLMAINEQEPSLDEGEVQKEAVIVSFLGAQRGTELLRIINKLHNQVPEDVELELELVSAAYHAYATVFGCINQVSCQLNNLTYDKFFHLIQEELVKLTRRGSQHFDNIII